MSIFSNIFFLNSFCTYKKSPAAVQDLVTAAVKEVKEEKHSNPPVIHINDKEYFDSPLLHRRDSQSSRDDRYSSSNTLVAIDTSSGSLSRDSSLFEELMDVKVELVNRDSGYDVDDTASDFSGLTSVSQLQEKMSEDNSSYSNPQNVVGTSDLGQSVSSSSRSGPSQQSSSDFDETEYSYFQEMKKIHQSAEMVGSSVCHQAFYLYSLRLRIDS